MTFLEFLNDIDSVTEGLVKYEHEYCTCLNIFFIILGSFFILVGLIDMIVFYVIPNNKIKKNKKKYPKSTFNKPSTGIVVLHFLQHIFLILVGAMTIFAIIPHIRKSIAFLVIIVIFSFLTASFYIFQIVLCAISCDSIPEKSINIEQISSLINDDHPINSAFIYTKGKIHLSKGASKTCYSKGGINLPVHSNLLSPYFDPNDNPDLFILKIHQNIKMTDNLSEFIAQAKEVVRSCDSRYSQEVDYYPLVESNNMVINGKDRPNALKKSSIITHIIFGVGVYIELNYKSLPIITFTQDSTASTIDGFDYNKTISETQRSSIGKCEVENKRPHPNPICYY